MGTYELIVANSELEALWQHQTEEALRTWNLWKVTCRSQSPSRMPQRTPAVKFADRKQKTDLTPLDDGNNWHKNLQSILQL